MELDRHRAAGTRLLPDEPEVADEDRFGRVGQVVDLGHPIGAPLRMARHQVGDAGVALPEVLVRSLQALADGGQQRRPGRIGHVPHFVRLVAEHPQHVEPALVGLGQFRAAADTDHLRAAGFGLAFLARDVGQVPRVAHVGHIDDRGAVVFLLPGQRIELAVAVVADVSDPALPLALDGRLVGGAPLQVAEAGQAHVMGLRGRLLGLGHCGDGKRRASEGNADETGNAVAAHGCCLLEIDFFVRELRPAAP